MTFANLKFNVFIWTYMQRWNTSSFRRVSLLETPPRKKPYKKLTINTVLIMLPPFLSRGDQILEVNSVNVRHAALSKVHAILSKCPPGPVRLVIGRHPNPKVKCFILFWVWDDGLAVCPRAVTHTLQWWHMLWWVGHCTRLGMGISLRPHSGPGDSYMWETNHGSGLLRLHVLRKTY